LSAPPGIQCNVCLDEYTEENGAFRLQCMLVTSLPVLAKSQTMSAMSAFLFTLYEKLKTLKNDTIFIVAGATAFVPLSHLERGSPALHPLLGDGFSGEGCGEKRHLFFLTFLSLRKRDSFVKTGSRLPRSMRNVEKKGSVWQTRYHSSSSGGAAGLQSPMPPEARQMIAPAGSICMYHAATWHRSHVNVSARPRIGLLQAFVPDTIAEVSTLLLFLL
jgi:hypothetical protein